MRLLAYCLMPNHFHLVLWPHADGDVSRWMQWILTTHVRRYHEHYHTTGHVWQGRFKSFAIQADEHLLTVLRYVERGWPRLLATWAIGRLWQSHAPPPTFAHQSIQEIGTPTDCCRVYQRAELHRQSSARLTRPAFTGFVCM